MNNHRSWIAFLLMIRARQASSGSNLKKYYIALTNVLNDWKMKTMIIERNNLLKILSDDPRQASLKWEQSKQILLPWQMYWMTEKMKTMIIERNNLLKILSDDPRQASLKWEQSKQILLPWQMYWMTEKMKTMIIERNNLLKILSDDPRQASLKWEQSKQILLLWQ